MGNGYSAAQLEQEKSVRKKYTELNLRCYYSGSRTSFMPSEFSEWDRHDEANIDKIESQSDCTPFEIERMKEMYWSQCK